MFRHPRNNSFNMTHDGLTKCNWAFAWISLTFSTLIFFGSLIVIVWIVTYNYPSKWTFSVYIAASGTLFLTNVLSNALIISSKQRLSAEDRRISMRSSMIRRRIIEALENQLVPIAEAPGGFCDQEVQTVEVTKTPPPPYEDLSNGSSEAIHQLTPNASRIEEPLVAEDTRQLLNKILHAINTSRTSKSGQLSRRTPDLECVRCKTGFSEAGTSTCSQEIRNPPTASSEPGIYPELPEELLEHIDDPTAFVRALSRYQSGNRKGQYEENRKKLQEESRKKQLVKQEDFGTQALQNLVGNVEINLNRVSSEPTNTEADKNESLKAPSQNVQRLSPSKYLQQKLKANFQRSEQGHNYGHSVANFKDFRSQHPIRNFNVDDKSRSPTKASQTDLSSASPRVHRKDLTFTVPKDVPQDLSSKNPRVPLHIAAINRTGSSLQDLRSKSSHEIDSANLIGIPLKDYQMKRTAKIPNNLKSGNTSQAATLEDIISSRHYEQAFVADKPLERTRSTDALQGQQFTSAAMRQHFELVSNSLPGHAVQTFSKDSRDYQNLNPEEWFASWNRSLNNVSQRDASTLFGSRL